MTKLSPARYLRVSPPFSSISMRPEMMWQNSKVVPLMEWVSPGVASQTPVSTFSPFEASCAQVLNDGLPEMSRSGAGKAFFGAKSGLVSMVTRSDMAFFLLVAECSIDKANRIFSSAVAPDVFNDGLCCRMRLRHGGDMR